MSDARWGDPREYSERDRGDERPHVYDERDRDDHDPRDALSMSVRAGRGGHLVVPAGDLRDADGKALDPGRGDLRHLRSEGLVQTIPAVGEDRALMILTEKGRDVLETNRLSTIRQRELGSPAALRDIVDDRWSRGNRDRPDVRDVPQEFYAGLRKPRELTHDAQVYRAYLKEAERLREEGAMIRRIILDNELKRDYQEFLQERNRGRSDSDGRPDRSPDEIHRWAVEHELPDNDGHVQFPDARIEYEDRDGRLRTLDLEVETINYRGGHAASKASSGFSRHNASAIRVVGTRGDRRRRQSARLLRPGHHGQHRR